MAILRSLASAIGLKGSAEAVTASICKVNDLGGQADKPVVFQYFPESITDARSPNYSVRDIPGGSHPLHTFVSGGNRTITFQVMLTQERNPEGSGGGGLIGALVSANQNKIDKWNSDIGATIAYLRSFTYPDYQSQTASKGVAKPPPAAIVYLPNSGIISSDSIPGSFVGYMTQCDVTYEYFHRDGTPRIVVVSLSFAETVQIGRDWKFYGSDSFGSKVGTDYVNRALGGREATKRPDSRGGQSVASVASLVRSIAS